MVEILLATYNGEKYLSDQIDSLLSQTVENWTLLVHDDGSTDRTVSIIDLYQRKYPDKIFFIEDGIRNGGAKNNFSHLLSLSNASYIMFCDQDDVWMPNKVEVALEKMLEIEVKFPDRPILIHTDLQVVDKHLNLISNSMFDYQRISKNISKLEDILIQNNVTGCTMMLNSHAKSISLPIPKGAIMHDWWIAAQVILNNGALIFIDRPTIFYRQHDSNSIGSKEINLQYYLKRVMNIRLFARQFRKIVLQAQYFGHYKTSYLFFLKMKIFFKRLF